MLRTALHKFPVCASLSLVFVCSVWAQAGEQPTLTRSDNSPLRKDDMTSEEILKKVIEDGKMKKTIQGTQAQAALCPICHQPLYLHVEGFVCKPADSHIQKVEYVQVPCPICNAPFQASRPGNVNAKGGLDRDFCPHSVGRYAVHSTVWMCPDCGYAAQTESFDLKNRGPAPKGELVEFVKTKLTPRTREIIGKIAGLRNDQGKADTADLAHYAQYVDQNALPDWLKYGNALELIEAGLIRLPHGVQARLYCEAAHACRRSVAFELGSTLEDQQLLIGMGQTARRVNDWLMAECIKARESRLGDNPDPNLRLSLQLMNAVQEPETDPAVLLQGARLLDQKIAEIIRIESQDPNPEKRTKVTRLDQFIFHLRYAGILDRVGDLNGAVAQIEKAQAIIPTEPPPAPEPLSAEAKANVEKILTALRSITTERLDLINREKRYLYRAADHLMQAFYFEEQARNLDPALNCYLVGEMLRRSEGEPAAAAAWFHAARQLFQKIDPAQANPTIPPGTPIDTATAMKQRAVEALEEKKRVMLAWTEEQMQLVQGKAAGKEVDPRIKAAIAKVLMGEGVAVSTTPDVAATLDPRIPETTPPPPIATQPVTKAEPTPATSGLTRDALLKRYYAALQAHEKKNGGPPKSLKDLVTSGSLSQQDSCLDEQGRLICPETSGKLIYVPPAMLGEHSPIIVPTSKDTLRTRLFADGQVGDK